MPNLPERQIRLHRQPNPEAPDRLTADTLKARLDGSLTREAFVEACLANTRVLAVETGDDAVLLYYAMAALGRYARDASVADRFVALFVELERETCAAKVRDRDYAEEDLAFFWSLPSLPLPLFEPSELAPVQSYRTSEHDRPFPPSVMAERWRDVKFHEVDKVPAVKTPRGWSRYDVEDATLVYDTGQFAVLDRTGRPIVDLCSANYQHVYFTDLFRRHVASLGTGSTVDGVIALDDALMIQDLIRQPNYCHWLLDQLPRVRHLKDGQRLIMYKLAPFMANALESIGIDSARVRELGEGAVLQIERLSIESSMAKHFHHPCQDMNAELVDYLRTTLKVDSIPAAAHPQRNVYLSRNKFSRRRISNEPDLLACLAKHDFATVYPEELSLEEQIVLFRDAAVIVSPHGASLANIVFCKQTTVVEIFNRNYGTPTFYLAALLLGHAYQHVLARNPLLSEDERQRVGLANLQTEDIEVDIDALDECLTKVFGR